MAFDLNDGSVEGHPGLPMLDQVTVNAGVAEAAFAAALGVRLGGTNRYGAVVEERVALGAGRHAEPGPGATPGGTSAVAMVRAMLSIS